MSQFCVTLRSSEKIFAYVVLAPIGAIGMRY